MKNKLWIFTELFYPDETSTAYILGEIAFELKKYYDVNVVSGPIGYTKKLVDKEVEEKIAELNIKRVKIPDFNKDKLLSRTLKFLFLSFLLTWQFLMKVKKNDKVLMVTNPAPLLIFIGVINKLKKSNTYLIVHDVFPENALAGKLIPKGIVYTILKRIFSKAYAQFDNIIVLGEDMKEVIHNKISPFSNFSKLHVIQNWADTENLSNIITTKYNSFVDDRVHFLFAGNVGRLQRLEELIPLFGKYKRLITFTIIGSGALKLELEKMVEENNFDNIRFLDPLARSEQINFINSFDISVVSLEESMYGLGVPSKTYNIMACGKPILYIGPKNGEIDKLIQVYRIGWSFQTNSELESFLSTIDRMQITAISPNLIREIAVSMFSKKTIISKFLTVLQS